MTQENITQLKQDFEEFEKARGDKELLFVNNLKSIYCGKYKYLQPYNIFLNNKEQIIIQCKGK